MYIMSILRGCTLCHGYSFCAQAIKQDPFCPTMTQPNLLQLLGRKLNISKDLAQLVLGAFRYSDESVNESV